jgi:hypothetical protein
MYGTPEPKHEVPAKPPEEPVKAASEPQEPQDDPTPPGEEIVAQESADEPVDADLDDVEVEAAGEEGEEGDQVDDGSVEVQSLGELAEYLQADPEWLESLTTTQKVNGKQVEVKIADALATHRKVTAADSYLEDAKVKSKTILQEASQQRDQLGERLTVFATLIDGMEKQLDAEISGANLAQLRKDDPGEYAARIREYEARKGDIQAKKQQAAQAYREALQQARDAEKQAAMARLPEEREKLTSKLPEWADEKKASKEREKVLTYLQKEGFTDEQIATADMNGSVLALAVKAMRYDASRGKLDTARDKILKIPAKVLKPGPKDDESSKPKPDSSDRVASLYG